MSNDKDWIEELNMLRIGLKVIADGDYDFGEDFTGDESEYVAKQLLEQLDLLIRSHQPQPPPVSEDLAELESQIINSFLAGEDYTPGKTLQSFLAASYVKKQPMPENMTELAETLVMCSTLDSTPSKVEATLQHLQSFLTANYVKKQPVTEDERELANLIIALEGGEEEKQLQSFLAAHDQLLTAVLTELGWRLTEEYGWMNHKNNIFEVLHAYNAEDLLTSRDAVWEVLGLDKIEDGFWDLVTQVYGKDKGGFDYQEEPYHASAKATCPQLLEAWLEFRKGTK